MDGLSAQYAATLQADFGYRDDLAACTVVTPQGVTIGSGIPVQRRQLSFREVATGGTLGLQPTDIVLRLQASAVEQAPPQGSTLTLDDGSAWTVLSVQQFGFGDTAVYYDCISRAQV